MLNNCIHTLQYVVVMGYNEPSPHTVNSFYSTSMWRPKESGSVWFLLGGAIPLAVLKYWSWRTAPPFVQRIKLSTTVGSSG